jgi:hypothetical protein
MSYKSIVLALLLCCSGLTVRAAEQKHSACIQQYGNICPGGQTDVFIHCRTNLTQSQMGNYVCGIHSQTGTQYFPAEIKAGPGGPGGFCGYRILDIYCHKMPDDSKVEWHYDNCQGSGQGSAACPGNHRFFTCETPVEQIAASYCKKDGIVAPYQIFKYYDKPGGKCGFAGFMVGCHVPAS